MRTSKSGMNIWTVLAEITSSGPLYQFTTYQRRTAHPGTSLFAPEINVIVHDDRVAPEPARGVIPVVQPERSALPVMRTFARKGGISIERGRRGGGRRRGGGE